jgi:predicted nucleotidyltransferase
MSFEEARALLANNSDKEITKRMLADVPWIFHGDGTLFAAWRAAVAGVSAMLAPEAVFLVGSAALGYSLSPLKPGRDFRSGSLASERSDIDLAIVSHDLFIAAWERVADRDRSLLLGGTEESRSKLRSDVYWGHIYSRSVPCGTQSSQIVRGAIAATQQKPPFRGYDVRARIYRTRIDLAEYHVHSLAVLRRELQKKTSK